MSNTAKFELRTQNGEPTVTIRVAKGTTLGDIAKIQASLFAHPERLGEGIGRLVKGCPNCLSGLRIEFGEEVVNPAVRDIQDMFTHLSTEIRTIATRLSAIERGAVRPETVAAEAVAGVIEY